MGQVVINSRLDALKILGFNTEVDQVNVKKAYRIICKKCHPDNTDDKKLNDYYILATRAFEYLLNNPYQYVPANTSSMPYSSKTKIIGSSSAYKYNHDDYKKAKKKHEENAKLQKAVQLKELKAKSKELRDAEKRNKEKEILDTIRWLRIADIIHRVIEEDKNMKDV